MRFLAGILAVVFLVSPSGAVAAMFLNDLRLGSRGEDVRELQQALNTNPASRLADTGPGSPGQETDYFGPLTVAAVIRFQELRRSEILAPLGLNAGTGFVGPATRAALNGVNVAEQKTGLTSDTPKSSSSSFASYVIPRLDSHVVSGVAYEMRAGAPSVSDDESVGSFGEGPAFSRRQQVILDETNRANVDAALVTLGKLGVFDSFSADMRTAVEQQIRADVATSTDLRERFLGTAGGAEAAAPLPRPVASLLAGFAPAQRASFIAAATPLSFGGINVFRFLCTCSGTWALLIVNGVTPFLDVHWLGYTYTQILMSYNLPMATQVKGLWIPGPQTCSFYVGVSCVPIPTMGVITPFVGSGAY